MIFVTVGTHEQPFDRLLKCIDKMIEDGVIKESVIVQKGYTNYEIGKIIFITESTVKKHYMYEIEHKLFPI